MVVGFGRHLFAYDVAAALVDVRDACHGQRRSTLCEAVGTLGAAAAAVAGDGGCRCLLDPGFHGPGRPTACTFAWWEADDEDDAGENHYGDAGGQSDYETLR